MARFQKLQNEGGQVTCWDTMYNQPCPTELCTGQRTAASSAYLKKYPATTGTKRPSVVAKNLDYSWGCKNGVKVCMNTHGLPFSDNYAGWTVVHNQANCEGTASYPCGGASAPLFTPGNRTNGNPTAIYDYIVMQAASGQVKYYGALVDGVEENLVPITGEMYQALTGLPDVYSGDGIRRLTRRQLFGSDLIRYNKRIARSLGLSESDVDRVVNYLQRTRGMVGISSELATLAYKGVPVADLNNVFEVFAKIFQFKDGVSGQIPNNVLNNFTQLATRGRKSVSVARGGGLDIDFGAMIGQGLQLLQQLFEGPTQQANLQILQGYMNEYEMFMDNDFGNIERVRAEQGLRAALDCLMGYKEGGWKENRLHIQKFCSDHGFPIPEFYKAWYAFQADYETKLREAIRNSTNDGGPGGNTGGEYGPGAVKPGSGGEGTPSVGTLDLTTVGLVIGGIVLAMFLFKN